MADFAKQKVTPALSNATMQADFSMPAWSPAGNWLVAGLQLAQQMPNEQLWLMRPDGSDARSINGNKHTYGRYQWDPWGQNIVFQRLELSSPYPVPEITVWPLGAEEPRLLASVAAWPAWLS